MLGNWSWVSGNAMLITHTLYTYLRLVPEHSMVKSPILHELRQNEISLCVRILREHFQDCLAIGRDLVRLLQDVCLIPEFEVIWRDLLSNPSAFRVSSFTDISQLYAVRTPNRYHAFRITPEMEAQIRFMLTYVRMGSQRRYQTWFAQRFLSTPESETRVPDLIRFICCAHHPSNQILQSDILPRWAIIGWLLKCCKSNHIEANAKLALFYDWLFFSAKTDNIMNIEPAILVMVHSIPKYVDMTNSLLEFLFLLMEYYDTPRRDVLKRGITTSVDILVGKGVVRSLEPLLCSDRVASSLKEKLLHLFPSYCKVEVIAGKAEQELGPARSTAFQAPSSSENVRSSAEEAAGGIANRSHSSEASGSQNEAGAVEMNVRKKKRTPASLAFIKNLPMQLERLAQSLSQSREATVEVVENLLSSFLSSFDQYSHDTSKGKLGSQGGFSHRPFPITADKFAHQLGDVFKKAGYDFFAPLQGLPSLRPAGDESMSVTWTILRNYVTLRHPQLCLMLVSWQLDGLQVGSRLLCYVSRLAEELELSASSCLGLLRSVKGASHSEFQGSEDVLVKDEEGVVQSSSDDGEDGECTENRELEESEGATSVLSSGSQSIGQASTHKGKNGQTIRRRGSQSACRTAVADGFKSYEAFLNELHLRCRPRYQLVNSSQNQVTGTDIAAGENTQEESIEVRSDTLNALLMRDLQTCLVWNISRCMKVLPSVFRYLPALATGRENVVHLLVSIIDPVELLLNFEFRLLLGEFSVVGEEEKGLATLITSSVGWDSFEQQYFWRILIADLQAAIAPLTLQVLKICAACVNPSVHPEAASGFLLLLRSQSPSVHLVSMLLSLPPVYRKFAAVVIVSWMSSNYSLLLSCMNDLNTRNEEERKEVAEITKDSNLGIGKFSCSDVIALLNYLEDSEICRSGIEERIIRDARAEIRQALLKLAGTCGFSDVGAHETTSNNE
ncbi:hypothetical protein O6H91_06G078600 [Diphasiastrum complanatum]|nr:hypothetical protein O6H91_06G078600 [Diphasiastrum complanatum]